MAKTIRVTNRAAKSIRDTSVRASSVDPDVIEASLGAEATVGHLDAILAPITLFAIRSELLARLQSSGGRPALTGTSRRAKVPLGEGEWEELEKLALAVSEPGFSPSAGQIASVLLTLSVRAVISQIATSSRPSSLPIVRQLASQVAIQSSQTQLSSCSPEQPAE